MLLTGFVAQAQTAQVIASVPRSTNGTPAYVLVAAEQLANNVCSVQTAHTVTFAGAYVGAVYGCYPEHQYVVATFNAEIFPEGFYRSFNEPCVFSPLAPELTFDPNAEEKQWRWQMAGQWWRIDRRLPSQFSPVFPYDEIRRFTASAASAPLREPRK